MALFRSDKRSVLNRLRRHEWRRDAELQELLERLSELDLRLGDILWMVADSEPVLQHYGAQLIIQGGYAQAGLAVMREALDARGTTRTALVAVLPRLREDDIVGRVEEWFDSRDENRRQVAVEAVLAFPASRVASLLGRLLQNDSAETRWRALARILEDLGQQRPDSRIRRLLLRAIRDADERIRVRAVQALGRYPDPQNIDVLVERLRVESTVVKQVIVRSLETLVQTGSLEVEDRLVPLLSEGDEAVRDAAISLVGHLPNPARVIQKSIIYSKQLMGWMRERIQDAIRQLGDALLEPLIELMSHEDASIRSSALMFATNFKDPRMVAAVIPLAHDKDWWTQVVAIETLGELGDEQAVETLINFLDDEELRWSAAEALTRIGSARALKPLARMLGDRSREARLEAIRAVVAFEDPRVLPLLRKLAEADPDDGVRRKAADGYYRVQAASKEQSPAGPDNQTELVLKDRSGPRLTRRLDALLAETRKVGGSDLHIAPEGPPYVRLYGELRRVGNRSYSAKETRSMLREVLTREQTAILDKDNQLDFCYDIDDVGRYRANVFTQRRGLSGVFRVIPDSIPKFAELRLPSSLAEVPAFSQGLVLVCGAAGSGKTTTLACLINLINDTRSGHVLTLEDPIEYTHPYRNSLVNQREVGRDTQSFERALRAALREDPDVIVVGDLRDLGSIRLTVSAAETGHLVLATLSTNSAAKAISRIIDAFPPREQGQVRSMLAESLKMIVGQMLVPRKDRKGRVAAYEMLIVTPAVSNLIREKKTHLIPALMAVGRSVGMRTMDQSLMDLVNGGLIAPETGYLHAEQKDEFEPFVSKAFLEGGYAQDG